MARQLFGTDGVRGVAGKFPLDPRTVQAVGIALGRLASRLERSPEVILGIDTRESGPWLAEELAGGLVRAGARPRFAGLITTPGIAYLTRTDSFVAGVMISASHNPYQDNGIKIFGHSGYKLSDEQEVELESEILTLLEAGFTPAQATLVEDPGLDERYLAYLSSTFPYSLEGFRLVVDCAHGAATRLAPALFERLGARVDAIGCSPDGRNINLGCGALHVETLRKAVLARSADAGVALDGDADRAIFVSRSGKVVDGDGVMLLAARFLLEHGQLPGPGGQPVVVATVMSNLGLERALAKHGINMLRTAVGDRYVLEEMLRIGAVLGGEQSGHVIFHNYATAGDGLLTTLRVLEIMRLSGAGLDELTDELEHYPQRLVNIRVRAKTPFDELPEVNAEIRAAEEAFGDSGRILVRYSGTELLARVMIEGADGVLVDEHAHRIAAAIQRAIGSVAPGD
jgi:phosphoglucosamine mutase